MEKIKNFQSHNKESLGCESSNLITIFDFFGKRFSIYISGKEKQSTIIGAILGLLSVLAIILLSFHFIVELYDRKQVNLTYHQMRDVIPVNNLSNTPIVFTLIDPLGRPINKTGLFEIDVELAIYSKTTLEDGSKEMNHYPLKINYTKCDINSTFGEFKNSFQDFPSVNQLFCILPNSNNFTLFGEYFDFVNGFSIVNFYLNKCQNSTSNKTCLDIKEIDERLSNVNFAFTFLDNQLDHNNSTKVIRQVVKTSSLSMSSYLHKRYFYYIRQVFYQSDFGLTFQEKSKETFYQHDNYQFDVNFPKNSLDLPQNFGIFTLTNDKKVDYYHRSYTKLQNIVGGIGGVVKGIMICAHIINFILTRNYSRLQIVNSVLDFDDENSFTISTRKIISNDSYTNLIKNLKSHSNFSNNLKKPTTNKFSENKNDDEFNSSRIINLSIIPNKKHKKNLETTKRDSKKNVSTSPNPKKIDVNWCPLIMPHLFSSLKDKIEIINNSDKIIRENLSIEFIIQKFFEVEKLKQIILKDKNSFSEFNMITKPRYSIEHERLMNYKKGNVFQIESLENKHNFE